MAKKATKETEVVAVSSIKGLEVLESLKAEIDIQANNCLQIKIMDESTLSVGQQNLSKINQLVKTIDAKRKELKDPYFQAGKAIDATANLLVEAAEKAIEHLKSEVKNWELKKQEEAKAAAASLEAKAKEAADKIAQEANRVSELRTRVEGARQVLQVIYANLVDVAGCVSAITNIEIHYRPKEYFGEFADEAYSLKDNYLELIQSKKIQFESAATMSADEKALIEAKEELAKQKLEIEAKAAKIKEAEDAIAADKARKEEAERLKIEQEKIAALALADKTKGIKHLWKIELVDKSKLIPEWIMVDEKAVKEYLAANKETMKDGDIVNGIKFYKEISVSA
jgi:protein-tyrosine-phosphatase